MRQVIGKDVGVLCRPLLCLFEFLLRRQYTVSSICLLSNCVLQFITLGLAACSSVSQMIGRKGVVCSLHIACALHAKVAITQETVRGEGRVREKDDEKKKGKKTRMKDRQTSRKLRALQPTRHKPQHMAQTIGFIQLPVAALPRPMCAITHCHERRERERET